MRPERVLALAGLGERRPTPLSGGDISAVWRAGDVVVKTHDDPPEAFFASEARGLRALAEAGVRVPEVRWQGAEGLVISYLPPGPDDWPGLAEMLAGLHGRRVATHGWDHRLYLGTFPLPPGTGDWPEVWRAHRVGPLVRATWSRLGDVGPRLEAVLDRVALPEEGPVLVHGDLWGGNLHMSAGGAAVIDPSAQWAERGLDLAMMRLFGGFPERFWSEYRARLPIPDEVERVVPLYQVYFLLVHVWLFGSHYVGGIDRVIRRF